MIPDNDPNANPRGLAIRFHLADRVHTDIITHSTDGFPTRTGQEFLEFLRAAAASDLSKPSPSPIEVFLGTHPAALAFVQAPKPSPASFAKDASSGSFPKRGKMGPRSRMRPSMVPGRRVGHSRRAKQQAPEPVCRWLAEAVRYSMQPGNDHRIW